MRSYILLLGALVASAAATCYQPVVETECITEVITITVAVPPWETVVPSDRPTIETAIAQSATLSSSDSVTNTKPTDLGSLIIPPVSSSMLHEASNTEHLKPKPLPSPRLPSVASPANQQATSILHVPNPKEPQASATSNLGGLYQKAILERHNVHRANHSADPLEWSDDLANLAMDNAKKCNFGHDNFGQNLASSTAYTGPQGTPDQAAARAVTQQWYYDEVKDFKDYGKPTPNHTGRVYGHFTQVVWKSSKLVGCATTRCGTRDGFAVPSLYTVCNYSPWGNIGGEFGSNVMPPTGRGASIS